MEVGKYLLLLVVTDIDFGHVISTQTLAYEDDLGVAKKLLSGFVSAGMDAHEIDPKKIIPVNNMFTVKPLGAVFNYLIISSDIGGTNGD